MEMYKRLYRVEGNAYERGKQAGEQMNEQMKANYNNQVTFYKNQGYDYADWEAIAERHYVPILEKWAPEVLDEVRGMADGSDLSFAQVLAMTTAYEKSFAVDTVADKHVDGKCTSFLATGEATKGGQTVIGQTNDEDLIEWIYQLDVVVHHVDPETGKEQLIYTHPGVPAYMGMNNDGVAVLWTYIDNGKLNEEGGVPTCVIIRHLLECSSTEEAVNYLQTIPHDIPNEFGIGDKSGDVAQVECFPNAVYVQRGLPTMAHTNHNRFSDPEPEETVSATTFDRCELMEEQLKENYGNIDADVAKEFFKCHDRFPNGICVHPCADRPYRKTFAAQVYELEAGKMHITFGNACEHPYMTYEFDTYR